MHKFVWTGPLAIAALACATPVQAELLSFELTGPYSASWYFDSDPVPDSTDDFSFTLWDVAGYFPGAVLDVVDLRFWIQSASGGFTVIDFWGGVTLADTVGDQLFGGSIAAPVFSPGVFPLSDINTGAPFTLTIKSLDSVVPEPASWALMIGGFAMAGGAMRARRRATGTARKVAFAFA